MGRQILWRLPAGPPLYLRFAPTEPLTGLVRAGNDQHGGIGARAPNGKSADADLCLSQAAEIGPGLRRPDRFDGRCTPRDGVGVASL